MECDSLWSGLGVLSSANVSRDLSCDRSAPIRALLASGCRSSPHPTPLFRSARFARVFLANPQAKKFVESCPQTLKENVPKEEAEKLQKKLQELGATVSMA